ncbi:thiamine phosphate synthase [Staphylococcus felis]|uniref:thiamine phosphate synthase n=1 Tax=Staphylococcus felis TaxID=46127 RepID=UPI0039679492
MIIAVTPFQTLRQIHQYRLKEVEPFIDGVILRTPMEQDDLLSWVRGLMQQGFPKEKIIIHSNLLLALRLGVRRIHFREMDPAAFETKKRHPDFSVSMSVHRVESIQQAMQHHIDFGMFGHLFHSDSKPNQQPRTLIEVERALKVGLPLVAIGGINCQTVQRLSEGFRGIACIGSIFNENFENVQKLSKLWNERGG